MTATASLDPRRSWPAFLAASAVGLVALLVLIEPAPSAGLDGFRLIGFWVLHVMVPLALAQGWQLALSRYRLQGASSPWIKVSLAALLAAALFAPIAIAIDQGVSGGAMGDDAEGIWVAYRDEFLALAPPLLIVWLALNATRVVRLAAPEAAVEVTEPQAAPYSFMAKVPFALRGDLVALSAELHYLRVYTERGDSLILHGFGQAVAEVAPEDGLCIHRSHWVAFRHVTNVVKTGMRTEIELSSGLRLPVARSRRTTVLRALEGYAPEG